MAEGESEFDVGAFWLHAIVVVALGSIPGGLLFGQAGAVVTGVAALLALFWWVARHEGSSG